MQGGLLAGPRRTAGNVPDSCAELTDTYEWMWKRYEGDRMMRSNLQIAFEANGIKKK